jgi:hypothetical protein
MYGTPHTGTLHVVERYRLIDYEVAKEALERNAKENFRFPPGVQPFDFDPRYRGKRLQLEFTVEDEGAFTRDVLSGSDRQKSGLSAWGNSASAPVGCSRGFSGHMNSRCSGTQRSAAHMLRWRTRVW